MLVDLLSCACRSKGLLFGPEDGERNRCESTEEGGASSTTMVSLIVGGVWKVSSSESPLELEIRLGEAIEVATACWLGLLRYIRRLTPASAHCSIYQQRSLGREAPTDLTISLLDTVQARWMMFVILLYKLSRWKGCHAGRCRLNERTYEMKERKQLLRRSANAAARLPAPSQDAHRM